MVWISMKSNCMKLQNLMLWKIWQNFSHFWPYTFAPKDSAPNSTWDTCLHIDWYRKAEFVAEYNWLWPPEFILCLLFIVNFHPKLKMQDSVQLRSTVRPQATLPQATLTSRLHYFETGPKIFEQHWFSRVTLFYIRFTKFSSKLNGIFEKDWFWLLVHRRQHICEKFSVFFLNHIELIIHIASAHEEQHICEIMELNLLVRLT